jgi:hypothetical protein
MPTFTDILMDSVFGVCMFAVVGYSIYLFVRRKKTENFSAGGGGGGGSGGGGGGGGSGGGIGGGGSGDRGGSIGGGGGSIGGGDRGGSIGGGGGSIGSGDRGGDIGSGDRGGGIGSRGDSDRGGDNGIGSRIGGGSTTGPLSDRRSQGGDGVTGSSIADRIRSRDKQQPTANLSLSTDDQGLLNSASLPVPQESDADSQNSLIGSANSLLCGDKPLHATVNMDIYLHTGSDSATTADSDGTLSTQRKFLTQSIGDGEYGLGRSPNFIENDTSNPAYGVNGGPSAYDSASTKALYSDGLEGGQ